MERFKALGFIICAIALGFCNLATFAMIVFLGRAPYIVESNPWTLYIEVGLCLGYIAWGFERYVNNIREVK